MSGLALESWALIGALVIALALGLLGGATLGYFTAASDLQQERANAWERGFRDLRAAVESTWIPPVNVFLKVYNPYLRRPLAPAPPHVVIPTPGWAPQPGSQRLFDQDAPSSAAVALELRGDD